MNHNSYHHIGGYSETQDLLAQAELVQTNSRLSEVMELAATYKQVAFDLESNGFHRYPERICLIQIGLPESIYLLDPLSISDMEPLGKLLADSDVEIVVHSGDYDVRSLDREWGFRINRLFDTSIAAAFCGSDRLGLGSIVKEYLDIELNKSKHLQRADWTIRPLSAELKLYASTDVAHLVSLRELFVDQLDGLARLEWVMEECARLSNVVYRAPDANWAFLSVKGSRTLDSQSLAVLRSLYVFREAQAVLLDRPPFKVLSDTKLIELAANPELDLETSRGLGRFAFSPNLQKLRNAIQSGAHSIPLTRPKVPVDSHLRPNVEERKKIDDRLKRLKAWRVGESIRLGLHVGLIWPGVSLERLAKKPDEIREEMKMPEIRSWQRRQWENSLGDVLDSMF